MIGVPSARAIQPGITFTPNRLASAILLPATELMAASKMNGGSFLVGAAIAMGFSPTIGFAPPTGATFTPPVVIAMPIMSCSSAMAAWYAAAPQCAPLVTEIEPIP